jgi:hypothetical protein
VNVGGSRSPDLASTPSTQAHACTSPRCCHAANAAKRLDLLCPFNNTTSIRGSLQGGWRASFHLHCLGCPARFGRRSPFGLVGGSKQQAGPSITICHAPKPAGRDGTTTPLPVHSLPELQQRASKASRVRPVGLEAVHCSNHVVCSPSSSAQPPRQGDMANNQPHRGSNTIKGALRYHGYRLAYAT